MTPLDSSDSDEDVIGTQSPPVVAAPDARVLEQHQDARPLIDRENRHGITPRDGCEGARSGPLRSQHFINVVLDGLKYLTACAQEPVNSMPWNALAQFVHQTNLLASPISTGQIKDRLRTVANAAIKRRYGTSYDRDLSPNWDKLSLAEKLSFFGAPCNDPPRPPWLAVDVDWASLLKRNLVKERAQKRRRIDNDEADTAMDVMDVEVNNVNENGPEPGSMDDPLDEEPLDYQPEVVQQPSEAHPANPPPAPDVDFGDDVDITVTAASFSDLVDKERQQLRRGDSSGALATRLERCGLSKSRHTTRASANQVARREKCRELLQQRKESTFPHTAVYLQSTDVTSIAKLEKWLVPWLTQSPEDAGIVLSIFERTIGIFATLRAIPPERQLPLKQVMKVKDARKLLDAYTSRGQLDRLLQLAHAVFDGLNQAQTATPRPDVSADERVVKRARAAAAQMHHPGGISAAMKLIESAGSAPGNADTLVKLRELCPPAKLEIPDEVNQSIDDFFGNGPGSVTCISPDVVTKSIRQAKKGKVHDLEGLRFEHLQSLVKFGAVEDGKNRVVGLIAFILETLARNPRAAFQTLSRARLVGVPKPKDPDGLRPIGITSVFRRLWAKTIVHTSDALTEWFTKSHTRCIQYAVGVRGGTQQLGILAQLQRDAYPDFATLQLDVKNAFNTIERGQFLRVIVENVTSIDKDMASNLLAFATALYGNGAQQLTFVMDSGDQFPVECQTGVTQGCGLGTALFAIGFHALICDTLDNDRLGDFQNVFVGAYADDAVVHGPPDEVIAFAHAFKERLWSKASLKVKEHLYLPGRDSPELDDYGVLERAQALPGWRIIPDGLIIAGNPVGDEEFIAKFAADTIEKHAKRTDAIANFAKMSSRDDVRSVHCGIYRHLALYLLDFTAKNRLDFLLHVTPTTKIPKPTLHTASRQINDAYSKIMAGEIHVDDLDEVGQALYALPHRLGGQAFQSLVKEAPLAFVGNVCAHASEVVKKLTKHDVTIMNKVISNTRVNVGATWFGQFQNVFNSVKGLLDRIDAGGDLPQTPEIAMKTRAPKVKHLIMNKVADSEFLNLMHMLQRQTQSADDFTAQTATVRKACVEAIRSSRIYWRRLETLRSAFDFTNRVPTIHDVVTAPRSSRAPNLITDEALPMVSRICLNQTILNGQDSENFTFAERFGFQALLEGGSEPITQSNKKSCHDALVHHLNLVLSRENGARITHETDSAILFQSG